LNDSPCNENFLAQARHSDTLFGMKTLLVTNIKGGVAKSSTAVAVAAGIKLLKPEARVLLIDGDPQGSIKTYFGLKLGTAQDFSTFLMEDTPFENATQQIKIRDVGDIDVMISSRRLADADMRMAAYPRREETLRMRFKKQSIDYDYCVIDSSPAMNLVLLNFMTFADSWLIPATMDAFAVSNISYLFEQRKIIAEFYDRAPKVLGILPTLFDRRTTVSQQMLEAVKLKYGAETKIFDPIPVDSVVKKAQVKRQVIYDFLGVSKAADSYKALSEKVVELL
jgi:chromosome partitioning protein